jgi:hypothetical protein
MAKYINDFKSSKVKYWGMAKAPATITITVRNAIKKTHLSDMVELLLESIRPASSADYGAFDK